MPPRATISLDTQENHKWFGRVAAAVEQWNPSKSTLVKEYLDLFLSNRHAQERVHGLNRLLVLLEQAQAELRLESARMHHPAKPASPWRQAPARSAAPMSPVNSV